MEAAGKPEWHQAVDAHGRLMSEHHQQLAYLTEQVTAVWEQSGDSIFPLEQFMGCFRHIFDYSSDGRETGEELITMNQVSRCAAKYALEFRTTRSEWNEPALKTVFHQGLNLEVVMELACCDEQLTLDSLIDLAKRLDQLLQSRRPVSSERNVAMQSATAEPMQLGRARAQRGGEREAFSRVLLFLLWRGEASLPTVPSQVSSLHRG